MSDMTAATAAPETTEVSAEERPKVLPRLSPEIEKTTRLYELMVLFDPAEASRAWDDLVGWVKDLIETRLGQHVLRVDKWADSRKLSYEIEGLKRATYMLVWFRSAPQHIAEIERTFRLDERSKRHLILAHEDEPPGVGVLAEELDAQAPARPDRGMDREFDRYDRYDRY
jgi:ribosomal protein S6